MRAAVLGSPISHSRSPALHRAAYAALGLDWTYEAIEIGQVTDLAGFLATVDESWAGLSLTMPLKQGVPVDERDALVTTTGSCNTVVFAGGESHGYNTDVHGIVAALRGAGVEQIDRVAVLGAGATAASALAAVHDLGAHHVRVLARSPERARALEPVAQALGITLRYGELHPLELEDRWPQLVVNTIPAGVLDAFAALSDPQGDVPPLLDVVYDPWPTPLAAVYANAGGVVVPGSEMLLHQAAEQVRLMTGFPAPLAAMRAAI